MQGVKKGACSCSGQYVPPCTSADNYAELSSDCRAWVVATFAGGGYTKNNVARCWTNETAALVGRSVPEELPPNTYLEYYAPDHRLNLHSKKSMENSNARAELERIRRDVMENLRHLAHTPGAPCHALSYLNPTLTLP